MDSIPQKRCTKCQQSKPATTEFFPRRHNRKSGLQSRCKTCRNVIQRDAYARKHPDSIPPGYKRCYKCKKVKPATLEHFYHHQGKGKNLRSECVDCATEFRHNRIAREMAIPGTHTSEQIREQYKRQKGKCYYCHKKVKWNEKHIDHTFPLSREGARNSIDHLVITCITCNLKKGNKYPWEWPEGGRLL